ncbi:YSC84-related protein [Castellaniella sp.]|uniref:lipid-binding SYLF domain-containing protein n=1 Tax=Castellaniella sp. TaxID=1955812 RepID=UPI002AFF2C1A|nr:YSC84-related protein [Castellaniella sp.]
MHPSSTAVAAPWLTSKFSPVQWASLLLGLIMLCWGTASPAAADAKLEAESKAALEQLYSQQPIARLMSEHASAVLVFPRIVKAGLIIGGEHGQGVLFQNGKASGHYSSTGISYGLQAGAQAYAYALFFMNDAALRTLDQRDGWEIGVGPSVVLIDQGMASKLSTTTMDSDIYAYIFGQQGLMAGIGIQGSKITRLD